VIKFDQFGELFDFDRSEIVSFTAIDRDVVEFPRLVMLSDKLPIAGADSSVSFMLPVDRGTCCVVVIKGWS
jgi:hypothetical protein